MNMIEVLLGGQAGGAIEQLGQQFGLDAIDDVIGMIGKFMGGR